MTQNSENFKSMEHWAENQTVGSRKFSASTYVYLMIATPLLILFVIMMLSQS